MDVDLDYQLIEVGGVTIPVFLPIYWSEEEGKWIVLSENNPLPITVKNHQDFTDLIDSIISNQGGTIAALNTLASLVDEMSLMATDRKSTRLNSSHVAISYAVFCLKKK